MAAVLKPQELMVVDWVALLDELRREGIHTSQLARLVQMPRQTIDAYRSGATAPSHANGEALIAFWIGQTRKVRGQLPMMRPLASAAMFHD